jgi:hypothetical protein
MQLTWCFRDHLCPHHEMSVIFNELTPLIAQEYFIKDVINVYIFNLNILQYDIPSLSL